MKEETPGDLPVAGGLDGLEKRELTRLASPVRELVAHCLRGAGFQLVKAERMESDGETDAAAQAAIVEGIAIPASTRSLGRRLSNAGGMSSHSAGNGSIGIKTSRREMLG